MGSMGDVSRKCFAARNGVHIQHSIAIYQCVLVLAFVILLSVPFSPGDLLALPQAAFPEPTPPEFTLEPSVPEDSELPQNAHKLDVLKLLGRPKEQIEHEAKRESVWIYKNGRRVHFREGKVIERQESHPSLSASPATGKSIALPSELKQPLTVASQNSKSEAQKTDARESLALPGAELDAPSARSSEKRVERGFTGRDLLTEFSGLPSENETSLPPKPMGGGFPPPIARFPEMGRAQ